MAHPPEFRQRIVQTLLYYEIFDHPLTATELHLLAAPAGMPREETLRGLRSLQEEGLLHSERGMYHLQSSGTHLVAGRIEREERARTRLRIARVIVHIMKRSPFVRGVFLSGDLSKGVAHRASDIDYVVITAPNRLWICRMVLIAFKKVFLLNSRKYFCLNYFLDSDHLSHDERNYFTATEIAHLKPLFNLALFLRYLNANAWVKEYFPGYSVFGLGAEEGNNRQSLLQRLLEFPFTGAWATALDLRLMRLMERVWKRRYPSLDERTRAAILRTTPHESRSYIGNFSEKVMAAYREKLDAAR